MVIHADNEDIPVDVPIIKKPLYEQKTYVYVENHVREILKKDCSNDKHNISLINSSDEIKSVSEKSSRALCICKSNESNENKNISDSDLEELRTVYKKCKAVINRIETKYGHLLNLDQPGPSKRKICAEYESSEEEVVCRCTLNKKIVYDDDGNQLSVNTSLENHICTKKPKVLPRNHQEHLEDRIQIHYSEVELNLPENLKDLTVMLRNPDLDDIHRHKIIHKIKSIRQEYSDEIRFNKKALIEKLKVNADEVLGFKGTNLSSLPGYS